MASEDGRSPRLPRRAGAAVARKVVLPVAARQSWIEANAVILILLAVGVIGALGLTAGAAEVYESVSEGGDLAALDQPVLDAAQGWRSNGLNDAVTFFTDLGGPIGFPIVAALTLGLLALWRRSWEPLALGAIALPVALAMSSVGKAVVGRVRPPRSEAVPPFESSPSFPSGHTIMTTTLMAVLAYLALRYLDSKRAAIAIVFACGAYAAAMGLSRVYLGHHWLTDVAAGWALGLGWVVALATLHQAWLLVGRINEPVETQRSATVGP